MDNFGDGYLNLKSDGAVELVPTYPEVSKPTACVLEGALTGISKISNTRLLYFLYRRDLYNSFILLTANYKPYHWFNISELINIIIFYHLLLFWNILIIYIVSTKKISMEEKITLTPVMAHLFFIYISRIGVINIRWDTVGSSRMVKFWRFFRNPTDFGFAGNFLWPNSLVFSDHTFCYKNYKIKKI